MTAKRPDGIEDLSTAALDVLERYTMFPWPLLKTQAEKLFLDPKTLDLDGLSLCIDEICIALARLASPEKVEKARQELKDLVVRKRIGLR